MTINMHHIIKYDHEDGKPLKVKETWCGARAGNWYFLDAQHAAIARATGSFIESCAECRKAIIKQLSD